MIYIIITYFFDRQQLTAIKDKGASSLDSTRTEDRMKTNNGNTVCAEAEAYHGIIVAVTYFSCSSPRRKNPPDASLPHHHHRQSALGTPVLLPQHAHGVWSLATSSAPEVQVLRERAVL